MNITWIDKKLAVSDIIDDYDYLRKKKIKKIINLRSECHDDLELLAKLGIGYYYIPIPDSFAPRFNQIASFIDIVEKSPKNEKILVHCSEGKGRSIFMCLVYLIRTYNRSPEQAIEQLNHIRPSISVTPNQEHKIKWYFEKYKAGEL